MNAKRTRHLSHDHSVAAVERSSNGAPQRPVFVTRSCHDRYVVAVSIASPEGTL